VFTFQLVSDKDTEPTEIRSTSRDILNWEKTTKGATLQTLMNETRMADMYKVAWFTAQRLSLFSGPLKDFEDTYDLEFETEESDPTPSAA
jgi:hypothetical protein